MTPTPLGEGKTTTTLGLVQGLGRQGVRAVACIRQPSQGPTFGIKGGAAGGGRAQVVPMEDFNLHLTGDFHAVTAAHNLIAAALDARLFHERDFSDAGPRRARAEAPRHRSGQHCLAARRRHVRSSVAPRRPSGLGRRAMECPASPDSRSRRRPRLMACLALTDGLADLRRRIGRMIVAFNVKGEPVTADDLGVAGAATALMRDAVHPTLLQTLEGQGVFVHAGPFANIAHGNSSILADRIALKLADVVVTESGFGADIGMEKFCDIKCRASGLAPDAVVLVATVRALKMHGGGPRVLPGKPLPEPYVREDLALLEAGLANLTRHIEIARAFGVPVVVAVNRFPQDSPRELERVRRAADAAGSDAVVADHWAHGGLGARDLADAVLEAAERAKRIPIPLPARRAVARRRSRRSHARSTVRTGWRTPTRAERDLERCERLGFAGLPVCMAKTHLSLSHDPDRKGVPSGFTLPVREVRVSAGAGFVYPLCGDMQTMPGLPARPVFMDIDIGEDGEIVGIS